MESGTRGLETYENDDAGYRQCLYSNMGRHVGPSAQGIRLGRPPTISPQLARRIRSLRTRGHTLEAICKRLNAEGVPTQRGGSAWPPSSLRAVLRAVSSA